MSRSDYPGRSHHESGNIAAAFIEIAAILCAMREQRAQCIPGRHSSAMRKLSMRS